MANMSNPAHPGRADNAQPVARADRRKVLKTGVISYEDHSISHNCMVRDVSESGAKLKFDHPVLLPKRFWLTVEFDAFKVECESAWSRGREMGVSFVGEKVVLPKTIKQELATNWEIQEDTRYDPPEPMQPVKQKTSGGPVFGKRT